MNFIAIFGYTFIDILFVQLHNFKFICLQRFQFFVAVDGKNNTLGLITYFIIILFTLKNKLTNIYIKTIDILITKLG